MVDEAQRPATAGGQRVHDQAAEGFDNRLISIEKQVDEGKTMHLQTTQAADQAKAAVARTRPPSRRSWVNARSCSQLDQAKMQDR